MGNALDRLTAARFDGPQALYTTAVRLLSERPAVPDDLAGPMCAAVKPLEWTVRHGQYEHRQAEGPFPNRSPFPDYIIGSNGGRTEWYWCNFGEWDNSPLPSEDAAKAAAQADYNARILSAITIRPEAEVRAEALREVKARIECLISAADDAGLQDRKDGLRDARDAILAAIPEGQR